MTDREILEKLLAEMSELKEGQKSLEEGQKSLEGGQKGLENGQKGLTERVQRLEVLLENTLPKHIQTIAEQHGDIVKRLDALADYPETRGRVATLEHVVKAHTQEIEQLKKAVG